VWPRGLVGPAAALAAAGLALAGCGFGAGKSLSGGAELVVTRDFGHRELDRARVAHVHESDTVMRFLQAAHRDGVETRYGGNFVQSIDGLAGNRSAQVDWFYYVNGIEASVGASDFGLSTGDRIQWDHHSWRATMRVPGIVGAYPEPFVHGYRGRKLPVRVECEDPGSAPCGEVTRRLTNAGVAASQAGVGASGSTEVARVVVARWSAMRRLQAASPLSGPPSKSGVFARFAGPGAGTLDLLNANAGVARAALPGTGLLAARMPEEQSPVWVVTGGDQAGGGRAAGRLCGGSRP